MEEEEGEGVGGGGRMSHAVPAGAVEAQVKRAFPPPGVEESEVGPRGSISTAEAPPPRVPKRICEMFIY